MTPLLIAADNSQVFFTIREVFSDLFNALIPIGICVVLPIIVISLVLRTRRHEVDKKTEVMLKAVENGTQLDPAFFQGINKRKERTVKDKLMGYLTTACITTGIGVLVAAISLPFMAQDGEIFEPQSSIIMIPCAILIGIGIAFFIVYAVGRKTWTRELAEENNKKTANRQ